MATKLDQDTARHATLDGLAKLLQDQHGRKLDVVAPATAIRAEGGQIRLQGTEAEIGEDGVTPTEGIYRPTRVCDEGLADKLGVPLAYLRRLRAERADLFDANVNGWLHGEIIANSNYTPPIQPDGGNLQCAPADSRSFLVRCFRGDGDEPGIARAFLSDRYGIVDNLDVLVAALDGVKRAGVEVQISGCDLTERRMYVRVVAPQIAGYAPQLLAGYRSPFDGRDVGGGWTPERVARASQAEGQQVDGGGNVVFAGFVISNSETGDGAFTLTPRLVVQVCGNGLTITADALRGVHLGSKMDAGVVKWSTDTARRALELVTARTRDAVATFLEPDYVRGKVTELEAMAGVPVEDAAKTVELVAAKLSYTQEQQASILDHFVRGGQLTAGGIMQAVTSVAQTLPDADAAHEMEGTALRALALAGGGSR